MPAAGKHILTRLQELRRQIELRMMRDPSFRSLCEDYDAAVEALAHWKQSPLAEAAQRVSEYQTLIAELEQEIFCEIGFAGDHG